MIVFEPAKKRTDDYPVSIIRVMNDVERIALIEESALPREKQDVIRYYMLQIARLAGESG